MFQTGIAECSKTVAVENTKKEQKEAKQKDPRVNRK